MNFLNQYKKGGDRSDKTSGLGGYIYLSKRDEQDLVLKVNKAFIKISENPKDKGAEKAIFEFELAEINETGQEDIEVGDILSYMINLSPSNKLAIEPAFKEFVGVLAACTGTREHDYFKSVAKAEEGDVSLIEEHLEDDCAVAQGNLVHVTTPNDPNDKGYYDLNWEPVED